MKLSEKFIKATNSMCSLDEFVNAPYLRKQFTLDFVPEFSEITICGLGFYELYINGENITKGPLAPYISNTDDVCYYDNYDITQKLRKGENVIGILLGNGMRNAYGGVEEFVPKFTYDGFQYAFVEGVEKEQITDDFITFVEMNSNVTERAGFNCSDEVLNKLFECARRSDLSNLYYFPTDCPHREKNGWTGDASISAEHLFLNLTVENTLKEWMTNIRMEQRGDGALPAIVPTGGWGFDWGNGPAWDAVCVNIPYYYYKYTGKTDIIEENVDLIYTYLKYIASRRDEKGLIHCGLGDWLDPKFKENGEKNQCPLEFADSAEIYDISKKACYLFEKTWHLKEAEFAKGLSLELRDAIRKNLIDYDTMTVAGDCQTAQAVGLERGIFNDDEVKRAQERLVEIVHRDNDAPAVGLIGIRNIYHALANAGESELAYKMITGTTRTCENGFNGTVKILYLS